MGLFAIFEKWIEHLICLEWMGRYTNKIALFGYFISALDRFLIQMPFLASPLRPWLEWLYLSRFRYSLSCAPRLVKVGADYMMKFKPNQTRTYDGEGFKKRAACLCFKNEREDEVWRAIFLSDSSRVPCPLRVDLIRYLSSKWNDIGYL